MRLRLLPPSAALLLCVAVPAAAQFKQEDPKGPRLGESQVMRWQAGMTITATSGACKGVEGYVPVPTEWPEQDVKIDQEDISPSAKVEYLDADGGVKVMLIRIAYLAPGEEAKALVTFEIRRRAQLAPENTSIYVLPDKRKLDRALLPYLGTSPFIESRATKIRSAARKLGEGKDTAWAQVEAIYDDVRQNVNEKPGPLKGATAALRDGVGSHEDMVSLFVALCRAKGVPARTVWVPGHCYAEFYLDDDEGQGHWFPCQVAVARAFGAMPDRLPILQKGDNFHPPYDRRDQQRYMAVHVSVAQTAGKPKVTFIHKTVSE
jgi:hypothetical protein